MLRDAQRKPHIEPKKPHIEPKKPHAEDSRITKLDVTVVYLEFQATGAGCLRGHIPSIHLDAMATSAHSV